MIRKIMLVLLVCIASLHAATVSTDKSQYGAGENIKVTVGGMSGVNDWIGIYPSGVISDDWEELAGWAWTGGVINGTISLDGIPTGQYDVRVFFNSSTDEVAEASISVEEAVVVLPPTVYENAENGISNNWRTVTGNYQAKRVSNGFNSRGAVKLTTQWLSNTLNKAFYSLPLNNANQKILEMDVGGVGRSGGKPGGAHGGSPAGNMPHFSIGVTVVTEQGDRTMTWDSFFNHQQVDPFIANYGGGSIELLYPSPIEHVRGYGYASITAWQHFRVDLNAYLQMLEPGNRILFVDDLVMTGGFIDNIQLSSN